MSWKKTKMATATSPQTEERLYHANYALAGLKPYEYNVKEHTPEQLQHIAASINEFGWLQPIVVDEDNLILIGHGRVTASVNILKLEHAPVWQIKGWPDAKKRAARIVDNKLNMDTGFNMEFLEFEIEQITNQGVPLEALGLNFDFKKDILDPMQREQDKDTTGEKLDVYLNNSVKQIVLLFDGKVYEDVLTQIREIMAEHTELINNTEVFLFLLNSYRTRELQ